MDIEMELPEDIGEESWEKSLMLDYGDQSDSMFAKVNQTSMNSSAIAGSSNDHNKVLNTEDEQTKKVLQSGKAQDWDPTITLNNLSFLEQKIHQLQDLVHVIVGRRGQLSVSPDELVAQQQQLITADLTAIIIQLMSTAGSLLPTVKNCLSPANPSVEQTAPFVGDKTENPTTHMGPTEPTYNLLDDHELKDEDDLIDEEHLLPGSYEIIQLQKEEILAPHTHFCTVCGKGFKRDANLRMHMRGHGDEYKTPAALAKPHKDFRDSEPVLLRRYSCPFTGCKRNKDHKKFQPLKTILCVKNHYKRTHCDKTYTCSRCNTKKFSVLADLRTHEKHCGRDKWLCSCGTTFSRKDKLFGHVALFQGHTPAIPLDENKGLAGTSLDPVENDNKVANIDFSFGSDDSNGSGAFFSLMGFDGSNVANFDGC